MWSQRVSSEVVSMTKVHSGPGGDEGQPRVSTAARATWSRGPAEVTEFTGSPLRGHLTVLQAPASVLLEAWRNVRQVSQLFVHPRSVWARERPAAM